MSKRLRAIASLIQHTEQHSDNPEKGIMMIDTAIKILNGYKYNLANKLEEINETKVYSND